MADFIRKIAPRFTLEDNPLDKKVLEQLQGVCTAIKSRSGRRKKGSMVVFSGPTGTDKTIAAGVLAQGLALDLYRVDLSAVVSKYIGETEKNLDRILSRAETSNSILFFDEADALFGRRSETNDADDRYTNLEMAYLMRRLEAYKGIVIITTNRDEHLDGAFQGQVLYPVEFPGPPFKKRSPVHTSPGVYIEECQRAQPITGVATSFAAFIGKASQGEVDTPVRISSWNDFVSIFGGYTAERPHLAAGVFGFFDNGGNECCIVRIKDDGPDDDYIGKDDTLGARTGLQALKDLREVSIVCIPGVTSERVQQAVLEHCETMRDRFCILDAAAGADIQGVLEQRRKITSVKGYGALYYPWIKAEIESETSGKPGRIQVLVPPSGHVAGIYARTDSERGVHKAPANSTIQGAIGPEKILNASEQSQLNPAGINCIRLFPGRGILVWGARTVATDPEWKYINVRRFIIFLEQSIQKGTQWVVFEPNDDATWMKLRGTISNFLHELWRNGALQGRKPEEAFFVQCDRSTMPQRDIDDGRLVCLVGVALLKPAEFLILKIAHKVQSL